MAIRPPEDQLCRSPEPDAISTALIHQYSNTGVTMSQISDLRSFLDVVEEAGQLVRICKPVAPEYELADVAAALERRRQPAPLFESVTGSRWPIFASAVANQTRAEVVEIMHHALEPTNGIPPFQVEEATWKAHVLVGDGDVRKLPIPTHAVGDGGPFITGAVYLVDGR